MVIYLYPPFYSWPYFIGTILCRQKINKPPGLKPKFPKNQSKNGYSIGLAHLPHKFSDLQSESKIILWRQCFYLGTILVELWCLYWKYSPKYDISYLKMPKKCISFFLYYNVLVCRAKTAIDTDLRQDNVFFGLKISIEWDHSQVQVMFFPGLHSAKMWPGRLLKNSE